MIKTRILLIMVLMLAGIVNPALGIIWYYHDNPVEYDHETSVQIKTIFASAGHDATWADNECKEHFNTSFAISPANTKYGAPEHIQTINFSVEAGTTSAFAPYQYMSGGFANPNGYIFPVPDGASYNITPSERELFYDYIQCKYGSATYGQIVYNLHIGSDRYTPPVPIADFTCNPLNGNAPKLVSCTDTTTNSPTQWNWSGSGPGSMLWGDQTLQNTTVYLPTEGNYTINHCASNAIGSDCETKTDYISLTNATNTTITTQFITIDAVSGYSISNASISLRDIQNNSWTNTTSTTSMGKAYITTLIGHTINAYASAAGFKDNDLLGVPAIAAPGGHIILMNPTGYYNVSPGWITLHVKVQDESTSNPISGASVSVGKSNGMAELWQTTNAAGIATFPVENKTDFIVRASASGYTAASKGVNSGTGNGGDATVPVNIFLSKATVTPTVTLTAGPGGTVPVTQDPYLSLSPEEKQSALATDVMNYGPMLVNFFILLTIVGGFKMITK